MSAWLESFSKWPAINQLLFSCVFVAAWLLLLFLAGIWAVQMLRYIAVCRKGWPIDEQRHTPTEENATINKLLFELLNQQMPTVGSLSVSDLLDLMTGKKKLVPQLVVDIKPIEKEIQEVKEVENKPRPELPILTKDISRLPVLEHNNADNSKP